MALGITSIKAAFVAALDGNVTVSGVPIPVYDLMPIQAIGEYIHVADLSGGTIGAKGENFLSWTQVVRCIYEFNMQSKGSTTNLNSISDQVFELVMAMSETSVTGYYLVEMELGTVTTTELVAENGRRLAINEIRFNFKLQEI